MGFPLFICIFIYLFNYLCGRFVPMQAPLSLSQFFKDNIFVFYYYFFYLPKYLYITSSIIIITFNIYRRYWMFTPKACKFHRCNFFFVTVRYTCQGFFSSILAVNISLWKSNHWRLYRKIIILLSLWFPRKTFNTGNIIISKIFTD